MDYDIPLMRPTLPQADMIMPYLAEIDSNRWYSNYGPLEQRLRSRFADMFSVEYQNIVMTSSGTLGLAMALREASAGEGGLCLMPSFTFVASAHAVVAAGLTPFFLDVEPESWTLDQNLVLEALDNLSQPVRAILAVAPFGTPLDIEIWDELAAKTGIPVVIDSAAGIDSAQAGQSPVVISLHATKPLGIGEGGLIMCRDRNRAEALFQHGNFGFREKRLAEGAGFNGKMSEYSAAVAHAALDAWPELRCGLRERAVQFRHALSNVDGISLVPESEKDVARSTFNVILRDTSVEAAKAFMQTQRIEVRQWWSRGCHREPAFANAPKAALSVTNDLANRVLGLPFSIDLNAQEIARIKRKLVEFIENTRAG
tara:strand:- start:700 stop:1809 length:1110 start_codon:yes stop_codon:yes gene_type:complete